MSERKNTAIKSLLFSDLPADLIDKYPNFKQRIKDQECLTGNIANNSTAKSPVNFKIVAEHF